jgi:hypothetical protein
MMETITRLSYGYGYGFTGRVRGWFREGGQPSHVFAYD